MKKPKLPKTLLYCVAVWILSGLATFLLYTNKAEKSSYYTSPLRLLPLIPKNGNSDFGVTTIQLKNGDRTVPFAK